MGVKVKYFVAPIIVGALLGGLAYTGWKSMNPTVEEEGLAGLFDKKETIYVWYSDDSMTDYINGAAVVYGDENGVRVIPHLVSESEYLEAINQASLQDGHVPDVFLISNDSLEKAYLAGLASEIQDSMEIVNTSYFPQVALDAVTYKGKLVAYPLYYETSILLYNETYLQEWAVQQANNEAAEAGVTYDAETLTNKTAEYMLEAIPHTIDDILNLANTFDPPEAVEGIFKWDVSDIFYNYYFVGNYLSVGGETGDDKSILNVNNPKAVACLDVYKNLNQFFYIESDTVSYESVLQDFIDGKIVFTIVTTDAAQRLEQAKEEGTFAYEYGAATIPDPSKELQGRSLSVTNTVAVNGYSESKELANKFAAYLAGEYAGNLYDRAGKCPVNYNVIHDRKLLDVFYQEYENSISLPKIMETSNFWMELEVLFSKVWNGADTSTVLGELAQQIQTQIEGTME
jgi:maltose-binding protein MalE